MTAASGCADRYSSSSLSTRSTAGSTPSGLTPLALDSRQESATTGRRVATDPVEMKAL